MGGTVSAKICMSTEVVGEEKSESLNACLQAAFKVIIWWG